MTYLTIKYALLVLAVLVLYYMLPLKIRWTALLLGNAVFVVYFYRSGCIVIGGTVAAAWIFGKLLDRFHSKLLLGFSIVCITVPWIIPRLTELVYTDIMGRGAAAFIVPVGISFYTLQLIAYLSDIYSSKISSQPNILKFTLFATFFPQLIQGPIPRYDRLSDQLTDGHRFSPDDIRHGFYLSIWGVFLKVMIADRAGVYVDAVYSSFPEYQGAYVWIAMFLYSIQLYTDFMACTTLSIGVSRMFGIRLEDNFARPYLAVSIGDFWRRWHISLSSWLRDYIYIPLGGSRKGTFRRYINLLITFVVSGFWHGVGLNFLVWGLFHAVWQIISNASTCIKEKITSFIGVCAGEKSSLFLQRVVTFVFVSFAWVIFRAEDLAKGVKLIGSMFRLYNPWVIFNQNIWTLGVDSRDAMVLFLSLLLLVYVSLKQEKGTVFSDRLSACRLPVRWGVVLFSIAVIVIFGSYGYGYSAQDFIYGGF